MKLEKAKTMCTAVQKMVFEKLYGDGHEANTFAYAEQRETVRRDGIRVLSDVVYSDAYPNSVMDIWYPAEEKSNHRTMVYFHGGGMLFGDKASGDPLAKTKDILGLLEAIVKAGFTAVSVNYVFAPEYTFPSQLFQMDQALDYLRKNQQRLGLNMNQITLGGSSAGANLTGIYAAALSNPEYSEKIGLKPCVTMQDIHSIMLDEPVAGIHGSNEVLEAMLQTWADEEDMENSERGILIDFPEWIKDAYPDAWLIASNQENEFYATVCRIKERLNAAKIRNELFYVPRNEDDLAHGFMTKYEINQNASDCLHGMLDFISAK
ncbi:MAG: alpha/beta hydrolase [Erysipelotrichaceae bacterium]|nr:alpha/beta hydrolase [Erysipelotrichaceae bacterium]